MKILELVKNLEKDFPLSHQESYDNSGFQISFPQHEITGLLLTLDIDKQTLDEAIEKKCNLIISHHPLLFKPIKNIRAQSVRGDIIIGAIQHEISLYSMHTNFDNSWNGTNRILADLFELQHVELIEPKKGLLKKLITYVPNEYADKVRNAIFIAGGGFIGNYDSCSYNSEGFGTFKANEACNPFVGEIGEVHHEPEVRIETIFPAHLQSTVIQALISSHPYEEVAYDIYPLDNEHNRVGLGMFGQLIDPMPVGVFLSYVKTTLSCQVLKTSKSSRQVIQKVAICSGSGASFIPLVASKQADAYITADTKYHDFTECPPDLLLIDAGHFETEVYFIKKLFDIIQKKNTNFAVHLSENCSNPVNYF